MDDSHAVLMDRTYRYMKHVYDISRPFFLAGRAAMRQRLIDLNPSHVLEVGSGTGRNLIRLARALPSARLTGLDISKEMTDYAAMQVRQRELNGRIVLYRSELADYLTKVDEPSAEVVIFSYSLTMIPNWQCVLRQATEYLSAKGGRILIVDFYDMASWPSWVQRRIFKNMSYFHVTPRLDLVDFIQNEPAFTGIEMRTRYFFGRYAILLDITIPMGG